MENLGPTPARFDRDDAPLSGQRAAVLEHLQHGGTTLTVTILAEQLSIHTNTARKHLEALVARGLVTRELEGPDGKGRPGWLYAAAEGYLEPDPRVRDYAGLAAALAGQIARTSVDPAADALAAGEAWGSTLTGELPSGDDATARSSVVTLLGQLGFAPDADDGAKEVRLRRCPLLDAARAEPGVVCSVHLGIVRGALATLGGDPEPATLLPFAEPGACLLHLAHTGAEGSGGAAAA